MTKTESSKIGIGIGIRMVESFCFSSHMISRLRLNKCTNFERREGSELDLGRDGSNSEKVVRNIEIMSIEGKIASMTYIGAKRYFSYNR